MGFAALPNQLHRKSVKKGFDFTLMVAGLWVLERVSGGGDVLRKSWPPSCLTSGPVPCTGESGLGKSTLINSLFLTNLYVDRQMPDASGKSTPFLHRLPIPTSVPFSPLWCPLASSCVIRLHSFSSYLGTLVASDFSLRLFPPLKTPVGSCGIRNGALLQSPTQPNCSVPIARTTQTLTIERRGVEIEEGGIKVKLTLVDTPGFGDSVDCSDW